MTDLERAQAVLHEVSLARSPVKAMVAIIAAARREGAEAMQERAARCARYWTASQKVADHILALPLTPEEPP